MLEITKVAACTVTASVYSQAPPHGSQVSVLATWPRGYPFGHMGFNPGRPSAPFQSVMISCYSIGSGNSWYGWPHEQPLSFFKHFYRSTLHAHAKSLLYNNFRNVHGFWQWLVHFIDDCDCVHGAQALVDCDIGNYMLVSTWMYTHLTIARTVQEHCVR